MIDKVMRYQGKTMRYIDGIATSNIALVDIDGNVYHSVKIGTQIWLVENLKTTRYKDGTPIVNIDGSDMWGLDVSGAYCWYNNDVSAKEPYGALYNWYAVNNSHGLAPEGWRIPTAADVSILYRTINNDSDFYLAHNGGMLKEVSLYHWFFPNAYATDDYGFKAVPGGMREYVSWGPGFQFMDITGYAYHLISDDFDASARSFGFHYDSSAFMIFTFPKNHGQSVRCIKDE